MEGESAGGGELAPAVESFRESAVGFLLRGGRRRWRERARGRLSQPRPRVAQPRAAAAPARLVAAAARGGGGG